MNEINGGMDIMELAVQLARTGQSYALATVVWRKPPSSGQHGSKAVITSDGQLHGWIGGACAEPVVIREAKRVLAAGEPSLIWLGQDADFADMHIPEGVLTIPMSCQSEGALQLYIEPVLVAPEVVIVGRSPMAMTLLELVRGVGWRGELIDGSAFTADMVHSGSIVIVATQGHGDEEVLETAVGGSPAFIGLVASAKRGEAVKGYLSDRGVPPEKLSSVHVPVGLDLGHTTHREIAVAILGELVQRRAAGELRPLLVNPSTKVEPEDVIDLVCNMTVASVPENRPFEYHGVTYYFCAPGCRVAFEKDPEKIHQAGGSMLITQTFDMDQPVEQVWNFFDDIPLVAACIPGADLTEKVSDDEYRGDVTISAGPVKLEFTGVVKIKSRDDARKVIVLDASGADKKGRGSASAMLDISLVPLGGQTRVNMSMDLAISGAAAQYGRGLVKDFTGVLVTQTAGSMKLRMTAIAEGRDPMSVGGPKAASGLAIGFSAFSMAAKRVFARFFLPYQSAPSR